MLGSKKAQQKIQRSRSRSLSPPRNNNKEPPNLKNITKPLPKTSRPQLKNNQSPRNASLSKSTSKKSIKNKGKQSKLNRSASQPKLGNNKNKQIKIKPERNERQRSRSKDKAKAKVSMPQVVSPPTSTMKIDQKQMGIIYQQSEHDKVLFKNLDITDPVFDKYLQMINNDNDAHYVMNALPELNHLKKDDQSEGRDFVSGRISRLSGIFENLSVDKIITPIKKTPNYYSGQCGKNLTLLRIILLTKFKVQVDVGFLQYSLDGDKLTIFRIYLSKIYRRMNYLGFVYLESLKGLISRHPGADRWSIFILEKNVGIHKFFKFLGFHIEKIATESKNKTVDYFQQFSIKKKDLSTVLASMSK